MSRITHRRRGPTRERAAVVGLAALLPAAALAATEALGTYKAWTATRFDDDGKKACMMWAQPELAEGQYQRRGEVWVFVTRRPAEQRFDRVSFELGYAFKPGAAAKVTVQGRADDASFELATHGSSAWVARPDEGPVLVKAMKAGAKMVVEGQSARGTATRDTYSLMGFTKAHSVIARECAGS